MPLPHTVIRNIVKYTCSAKVTCSASKDLVLNDVCSSQFLRYVFHLYVEEKVESVKFITEKPMLNGSLTLFLECCSEDRMYWRSPQLFIHADEEDNFRYRYVVKYKEGFGAWLFKTVTFSRHKDEKTVKETNTRKLNRGMNQFDIFHNPSDPNRRRSVFVGQFFFVKLLCQALNNGNNGINLGELLIECEHIGFGHPSYTDEDVNLFLNWVENLISRCSNPYQGVYVCSLLGQFVHRVHSWPAGYTCRSLEKKAVDLILASFWHSPYTALPQSSIKFIKVVAEDLFKAGSSTGCLQFIKYFCNLLDVNYVMQVADKLSSRSYTEQQFDQQVPTVLDTLTFLKNPNKCLSYSLYVISCSPSVQCLWSVYHAMTRHLPDLMLSLEEGFSDAYCKFISRNRGRKPDLLQPLFWCQAPGNLKEKLANPFCKALHEQITSETVWSKERMDSLKAISLDASLHSSDQFHPFILGIITHKCKEVVSILPDLLDSTTFFPYWKTGISDKDKERACHHWLRTGASEAGVKPKDRVLGVVEACELLCSTVAVKTDKPLCQALEKEVESLVLIKTNYKAIMDALIDAQSRPPAILERLTILLRSAIKQQSGPGDCRSRYRKMIRMLGYDVSKEGKKVKLDR